MFTYKCSANRGEVSDDLAPISFILGGKVYRTAIIANNKRVSGWKGISTGISTALNDQGCSAVVIDLDANLGSLNQNEVSKRIEWRKKDFEEKILQVHIPPLSAYTRPSTSERWSFTLRERCTGSTITSRDCHCTGLCSMRSSQGVKTEGAGSASCK